MQCYVSLFYLLQTSASVDFNSVQTGINELLSCASSDLSCKQETVTTLKQLSLGDLNLLAHDVFKVLI